MKADQIYTDLTNTIIEKLEAGLASGQWKPPWTDRLTGLPHNATTGKAYTGGNVIALWITEIDRGYPTSEWATYRQWESIGATVRPGQNAANGSGATHLIKWVEPSGNRDRKAKGDDAKKPRIVPVGFAVFNAAQVDGYEPPVVEANDVTPIEHAEAFFAATGSNVKVHNEGQAYYSPGGDYIVIPPIGDFRDAESYYATLAHEHVHWTGAKSRLDRDGIDVAKRVDREVVAYEELIAELGSAFLGAILGVSPELRDDHVQYLRNWLGALRNDNKLLFRAASAAQKGVDFLSAFTDEKEVAA